MTRKVWDIRWVQHPEHYHVGQAIRYGWHEVYCVLHDEVYGRPSELKEAEATIKRLNECEAGKLWKTTHTADHLDKPFTYTEVWCHGGKSKGHFVAGWYQDGPWVRENWTHVGVRFTDG